MKKSVLNAQEAQIPTSSMADIAFLLIVFFMLTSTMSSDKGIEHMLGPGDESQGSPLVVWVDADGAATINGQFVSPAETERAAQLLNPGLHNQKKGQATLLTHDQATYGDAIRWLDLLETHDFEVAIPSGSLKRRHQSQLR